MATIPSPNNFGTINCDVGSKTCNPRLVKVPFAINGDDISNELGDKIPFSFSLDLSTITQGLPSPTLEFIQGLIFNNPNGGDTDDVGSHNLSPLRYNLKFSNGFECDINSGGLIYMPLPLTPPTSVIITAEAPSSIFPQSSYLWLVNMYFSNFALQPGTIGGFVLGN